MNILSVVSEFRRNQIFTKDDYAVLESLGDIYYLTDEQIKNIDSEETRTVLEEILPKIDACFSYVDHIPEELISKHKNIKIVAEIAGALPKYSLPFYKESIKRGVKFLTCSPAFAYPVAEYALGQTINLLRNISKYHMQMIKGEEKFYYCDENSSDKSLYNRKIGIIGFGRIAREYIRLVKPFTPEIKIYDPFVPDSLYEDFGVKKANLEEALSGNDVVILMANPNEKNYHLINKDTLALLDEGTSLINVARASLVNTKDLIEWLKQDKGKAAIDVFEKEPLEKESELRSLKNIVITPHRAGGLLDTYKRIGRNLILDMQNLNSDIDPQNMYMPSIENIHLYSK